jgi:hypothetical protein
LRTGVNVFAVPLGDSSTGLEGQLLIIKLAGLIAKIEGVETLTILILPSAVTGDVTFQTYV